MFKKEEKLAEYEEKLLEKENKLKRTEEILHEKVKQLMLNEKISEKQEKLIQQLCGNIKKSVTCKICKRIFDEPIELPC